MVSLALAATLFMPLAQAQDPKLHVNTRWKECSFQLDPSLTPAAWKEFTREAGEVAYLRPVADAMSMGRGKFEVSIVQWRTAFDDAKPAWNDTFVHPDTAHWLKEEERLTFPGLFAQVGLTDRLDVGLFITKSPGANYGFAGGSLQYQLLQPQNQKWALAGRVSFNSLYGPSDLSLRIYGADLVASREFSTRIKWLSVSTYGGFSTLVSTSHEKSAVVDLADQKCAGIQTMVGVVVKAARARMGVEYNQSKLSTLSLRLGVLI